MVKTTSGAMDTHLASEVTTLATAALIERTDGFIARFTSASMDVDIDVGDGNGVQTYSASEGTQRTNISNDSELNADNLDILGVFDNAMLDETELRRGLYDFATFLLFVFNHQDTSQGVVKIFRGQFGEVLVTKPGVFRVTCRSLIEVYTKETGEHYSKDCRADLGDIRCRIPLWPDENNPTDRTFPLSEIIPIQAYEVGDFVIIPTAPDPSDCSQIVMNFEGADGATSGAGFDNIGTAGDPDGIVGTAQIDTAQMPAGGDSTSSLLLDGDSDYLSWTDIASFELASNPVTISCHFRLNATGVIQIIASQYQATTTQRGWQLFVTAADVLQFSVFQTGATLDISLVGTTPLTTGVDYHAAAVRKNNGDWVLFLDGAIEDGPTTPTADPFNSSADLRIGARESGGIGDFFDGWIDSFEFLNGFARWEADFSASVPSGNLTVTTSYDWSDYGDRVYECTTEGTSDICIATPDTTITNTHSQGTAIFTANHSWMRTAVVLSVGANARREFTVTELTPNSGEAVGSNQLPSSIGFPDDWFNGGAVIWETGDNAGRGKEIRNFVADDGVTIEQDTELFQDMPFDIQVGDQLRIFPGCDKTYSVCVSKFNNGPTFVGEPFVPGPDILGQYPDAKG